MSFLQNFMARFVPVVKASDEDAELVDPQKYYEKNAKSSRSALNFTKDYQHAMIE